MDARGRLRLDAVARFLQDVAIEDVQETGWGLPDHLWFIRGIRIDVLSPFLGDRRVHLVTWCSGLAFGPDQRPARLEGFGVYAEAAGDRRVSTRPVLPAPSPNGGRTSWPLRLADVDLHGHVNNATHWQAVEQLLAEQGPDLAQPLQARLEYRQPIDLGDPVELVTTAHDDCLDLAFVAGEDVKAVARVGRLEEREVEALSSAARGG